jgi:hypothetical protein
MSSILTERSMRKTIPFFGSLLLCLPLFGQSALSIAPQHCVWQKGDDLGWAAPELDESTWHPTSEWTAIATPTPNFWLRCRFNSNLLAPSVQPALQVSGDLAWQAFADGKLIGASGNITSGSHTVGLVENYTAPQLAGRNSTTQVALRITFTPELNGQEAFPALALGDAEFQRNAYYSNVYSRVKQQWVTWVCYALIASAGLFFLALYWFDRTQRYVLWVSLTWLLLADLRINEFLLASSVHYSAHLEYFLYAIGQSVPVFYILFFFALNKKKLPLFYKFLVVLNLCYPLAHLAGVFLPLHQRMALRWTVEVSDWETSIEVLASMGGATAALASFWPVRTLRGGQIPLAVVSLFWMLMDFAYMVVQFPFLQLDINNLFLAIQPYRSTAIALVVVSLTLLLVQRVRSTNRERAALQGEMQAARQIQQLLVPSAQKASSYWTVDTAFLPAREVGGDFFRCRALPGGMERVLIGDVSGKGAAAAMTAAMLLGAAEGRESDSPAQLLAHLNRVFAASGIEGFATCLCAHLTPNGQVTVANAGHLAPYIDGREAELPPALPLGILKNAAYVETHLTLAPDAQLTFVSDGVVEARNAQGELFGFERTAALSKESAERVSQAAQAFGQEDDITVLTLTLAAAGVLIA